MLEHGDNYNRAETQIQSLELNTLYLFIWQVCLITVSL